MKKNTVICVTGMHRSGTSLLTRILNISGVYIGEETDLLGSTEISNPTGHWEHTKVIEINNALLEAFDSSWYDPKILPHNWYKDARIEHIKKEAQQFIEKMNEKSSIWGFKDPRTSLTIEFWKMLLPDMHVVVCFRDSEEILASLQKRGNVPNIQMHTKGLLLINQYLSHSIAHTQDTKRYFISYSSVLKNWQQDVFSLLKHCSVPTDTFELSATQEKIKKFIQPSLRHHSIQNTSILSTDALSLTLQEIEKNTTDVAFEIVDIKKETQKKLQDKEHHIKNLEKRCALHESEIMRMQKTIPWKIYSLYLRVIQFRPHHFIVLCKKAFFVLQKKGIRTTISYLFLYLIHGRSYFQNMLSNENEYAQWILHNEKYEAAQVKKIINAFPKKPKISIICPSYNIDPQWMDACFQSVLDQFYDNWELCIYDDASTKKEVLKTLRNWEKKDTRIKIAYGTENKHIAGASNEALKLATGEYIALLDCDDTLAPHALYEVVNMINEYPDTKMIYSDEDKIDMENNRVDPFFKPEWSPDLMRSMMYTSHLTVYKKSTADTVGGFRVGFEGSQDYDLALRVVDAIDATQIKHIAKVLYHWRMIEGSTAAASGTKEYALNAGKKALEEHLQRNKIAGTVSIESMAGRYRVHYDIAENPLVSIIIPFRDEASLLKTCIESIVEKTTYKNYEILAVNNQSAEKETAAYLTELTQHKNITILEYDKPFNYSAINNYAVTKARGEYVVLLNNDTEVIANEWLSALLEHAQQSGIGAVGGKLLFSNDTIQHAGVTLGVGGREGIAGHAFKYFGREQEGYFSLATVVRNVSAVTGACLMIKKSIFEELDGLDEENLSVAFNDVDFCIRVMQKGYRNIYTPFALLYHYESLSRGNDDELYAQNPKKFERVEKEKKYMLKKWKDILYTDPYYNKNLTLTHEDYSIKIYNF